MQNRDSLVGWVVAGVSLLALAAFGAEGAARWPWLGFNLAAAAPFLLLLIPEFREWVRARVDAQPQLSVHVPFGLAVYGMGAALLSGSHNWLNMVLWPVCVAIAVAGLGGRSSDEPAAGRLLLSGAALWALGGLWERPLQIRVPGGTHLGLAYLAALDIALFLYLVVRPIRTFDVRLGLRAREVGLALGAVVVLAAVAIPLGMVIGFLHVEPRWLGPGYAAARLFGLVVFVGLPEEMLFRGVFQESFSRLWNPRVGLVVGSLVFGLSHLPKHAPPLNWPYALLATLAGLGYGWVYQRTGRLAAAAMTHGVVDWIWGTFLGS
jgi:membrane protease YdiL (CAAX protease family)